MEAEYLSIQPTIEESVDIVDSKLGEWTHIGARTRIFRSTVGDYSCIRHDCRVANAEIGKFCSIAAQVRINATNHPMSRASQHVFTYKPRRYKLAEENDRAYLEWRQQFKVIVGHDAWIGHGAIINPDVTIGIGAVIGSGAVVTKSVEPYMVVAGVPARPIRRRLPADIGCQMIALAWWDWPSKKLQKALPDFRTFDAAEFVKKYNKKASRYDDAR